MIPHHFLQEIPDQHFVFLLYLVPVLRIELQIRQFTDPLCLLTPQVSIPDLPKDIFFRKLFSAEIVTGALYQYGFLDLLSRSLGYIITEDIHSLSHKSAGKQHLY